MYILASNMWFTTLIKQFFFSIDKIVFNFISSIYDVLITIARTSVLTQADIADMADRIYKLLAIFMVFKVTLSLITYVVNPDDFADKSKGISKLSKNIIISLALLILTPYLFSYAYQFQTIILEDNSLSVLIFGEESTSNGTDSFFNSAGDKMAYTTISAFFSPNLSLDGLIACDTISELQGEKKVFSDECYKAMEVLLDPDDVLFTRQSLDNYKIGVEKGVLGLMFRQEMAVATYENEFIMDYKFIFSTVVGVVIILLLISFCMDVAVRSIKLAFLQLVAPIPIISYVDPKSGKDGLFKKWYDMCFKTYLSLFIRLLALYFAVYIISKVSDLRLVDVIDGSYVTNGIVAIFVIIGALMFAKQLPKLLEGLGIKLDGGGKFTLNPLRKIENEALGGKLLKKPNDMLAKGAKALALSPFTGASLGARKLMAGIDSAAHGKGFRNGTKNVQGKLAQAKNKFMEKNLPHTAKAIKEAKEGKENIRLKDKQEKLGSRYWDGGRRSAADAKKAFLADVKPEYRDSFREMENKKGEMYKAQARAETYINAIKDRKLVGEDRAKLARELGYSDGIATDDQLIQGLNKYSGTAEKQFKEAESRHAEMRKMDRASAEKEAAFDYYDKMHSGIANVSEYKPTERISENGSNETSQNGGSSPQPESAGDSEASTSANSPVDEDEPQQPENNDTEDDGGLSWNRDLLEEINRLESRRMELQEQLDRLVAEYNDADTSTERKTEIIDEHERIRVELEDVINTIRRHRRNLR